MVNAAHGASYGGGPAGTGRTRGFQLWLVLQPDEELGGLENVYLSPEGVARDGVHIHAKADVDFVLGSAAAHTHGLVLGKYSVQTSALTRAGEQRIDEIQRRLQKEGRF